MKHRDQLATLFASSFRDVELAAVICLCISRLGGIENPRQTNPRKKSVHISLFYMYVCMVITYSKSMDQPGNNAHPARGQLTRENEYFPVFVRA